MAERKEKLIRVLQLLESTDEKSPMNAAHIIEKLKSEYTLGDIDRKSIYRDIELLQYCGYSIEQSKDKRKGWYMEKHAFDDWEIKIMMDAVQQAKCISVNDAVAIRGKLLALTSKRGRSRFSHLMIPKPANTATDAAVGMYIELMLEAMYQKKKIEFQYTELTNHMERVIKRDGHIYKLNLYTIYWSNNNYYLIGAHDNYDDLTNYRLDRVLNLRISEENAIDATEKIGQNPEDFIREYIERSVNHFSGEKIRIQLEYVPDAITNAILYDFAGDDVKIIPQKNGKYKASFSKLYSVTLLGWLLQYANRFKVISPEGVRVQIVEELESALKEYKD